MANTPEDFDIGDIPPAEVVPKRRGSLSLVWLIPIVAALVGGWLAVKAVLDKGPTITITFKTAEGLEAGKTKIKYKNVDVGEVNEIHFTKDLSRVVVTVEVVKGAAPHLVEDTRFWVVRARVAGGQVTGLGTLWSGSYSELDVGKSPKRRKEFEGREVAPIITGDVPGHQFVLRGQDLGSHDVGTPVFVRRVQVGRVVAHELNRDGSGVTLKIFVEAPHDRYVNPNTRFWDQSGIDITADATGVKINTASLVSIMLGGIAFETPANSPVALQADEDTIFILYPDRAQAMKRPDTEVVPFTANFTGSLRGLSVGAPLDFSGVPIGEVRSIGVELDDASKTIHFPVELAVYPERLRSMNRVSLAKPTPAERKARMDGLVEAGLRAQLRTGSLLTGQLFVAFDFFPNAPKAKIDWTKTPPEIPTEPSGLQELQIMLAGLSKKLEKVPFDKIGADLQQMLQSASSLVKRLDTEVAPEARATLAEARKTLGIAERSLKSDAPLQQDAREALREVGRAAQAMRVLADYLERHPEALIRGKKGDKS